MVSKNLSTLGLTPTCHHAYLRVDLENFGLTSIDAIRTFVHLQFVNVSHNKLRSLEPLSKLPYLLHLCASHNFLERTQTFGPPRQMETCDLSFNSLVEIGDWSAHKYLRELNLKGNLIPRIPDGGLRFNKCLRMVDLSQNHLRKIENFPPKIEALFLSQNQITSLDGIQNLPELQVLNVKQNLIV